MDTASFNPALSLGDMDVDSGRAGITRDRSEDNRSRYSIDTCDEKSHSQSAHNFSALKLEDPESCDHDDTLKHTFYQVHRASCSCMS